MDQSLRTLIHRLSQRGLDQFCDSVGIRTLDVSNLGPRQLTKGFEELLLSYATLEPLHSAEAHASQIIRLTDMTDICEEALRAACADLPDLLALVTPDTAVEDRALALLIASFSHYQRACNIAASQSFVSSRYHCRFRVSSSQLDEDKLVEVANEIRSDLQKKSGGHRVRHDLFDLHRSDSDRPRKHIAVYVERGATAGAEFDTESDDLVQRLYRPAIDIGITFDPATGTLDIAGKSVGGSQVFEVIAQKFARIALKSDDVQRVKRQEWNLTQFMTAKPELPAPPAPFARVRVMAIGLRRPSQFGGKAEFTAGSVGDAYDRMRNFNIGETQLRQEQVSHVQLELTSLPTTDETPAESGIVVLRWPNSRAFTNLTHEQKIAVEAWLDGPFFEMDALR